MRDKRELARSARACHSGDMSRAKKPRSSPPDPERLTLELTRQLHGGAAPAAPQDVPTAAAEGDDPMEALMARYSRSSPRLQKGS